jgi:hypothetical protein
MTRNGGSLFRPPGELEEGAQFQGFASEWALAFDGAATCDRAPVLGVRAPGLEQGIQRRQPLLGKGPSSASPPPSGRDLASRLRPVRHSVGMGMISDSRARSSSMPTRVG